MVASCAANNFTGNCWRVTGCVGGMGVCNAYHKLTQLSGKQSYQAQPHAKYTQKTFFSKAEIHMPCRARILFTCSNGIVFSVAQHNHF